MSAFVNVILAVQMLTALAMIGLILIQHGKGADMGAAFGSGGSGSLFGASGSANFLSRTTAGLATVFFVATLALAYLGNQRAPSVGSVLEGPAAAVPTTTAPPPEPAPAPAASAAEAPPAAEPAPGAAQIPKN
ncbi:preprotein translocase subunit SecG [Melaminivora sp.]|uniref:preprotein translocase subunit SecG n=1 Tax=Melaminivora sp. TaxID=1933032 RepID=UPI0028A7ABCF|nr:preprotein translocase subunit SecG [Melaminivora sp.]